MKRWRALGPILSMLSVGALLLACGGMEPTIDQPGSDADVGTLEQASKVVCAAPKTVALKANGKKRGTISIRNTDNWVYVTYTAKNGWAFQRTAFALTKFAALIPRDKNDKFIEQLFWYRKYQPNTATTVTHKIRKWAWWPEGTRLYLAAWAKMVKVNKKGKVKKTEYAWSKGSETKTVKYKVGDCYLDVNLPPNAVTMVPKTSSKNSSWVLNLSNVPDGYDVWNGPWNGWCVEKTVYMTPNKTYTAKLVSSQDTKNLPDRAKNVNWPMVNYLLNHPNANASVKDVQDAIWYLLGYIGMPSDADAKALITQAQKYGKNFRPNLGDQVAVVFLNAETVQLVFLEVYP